MRNLILCVMVLSAFAEESIFVDLRNAKYRDGTLETCEGGVIKGEDIRIQAKCIHYTRKGKCHRIQADGDLLIQYKGRVFVGRQLEYDFQEKTGVIYDGKSSLGAWFVGADEIRLNADGSYEAKQAFITTSENQNSSWDLLAGSIKVIKGEMVETKRVRFRLFQVPVFWLPSFKINMMKFHEPVFDYAVKWDSGMGPRFSARYQFYSWKDFAMFGRLEYRWGVGWGGAFETEYLPSEYKTRFVTRSYLATDRLEPAPNPKLRYRVQGDFHHTSEDDRTEAVVTWDKYSDVRMQSDFTGDDFEIQTAKKTLGFLSHKGDNYVTSLKLRPRANPFESIKQDLPTLFFAHHRKYFTTMVKASYLDFAYSNHLFESLPSYHAPRVELREKIYRPFYLGPVTFTPIIGGEGIFYGNSPESEPKWLGLLAYGATLNARAIGQYGEAKHQIEPYAEYIGLTKPTVTPDDHYIFSIADGYDKLNQIRGGVRNLYFQKPGSEATFLADLYVNSFFADFAIPQFIPYGYLDLSWRFPRLHLDWYNSWNFRETTLQYSNLRLLCTINDDAAFTFEARYRSRFDWRKADHDNFILDVSRSQSELLLSPLSDRRITLLSSFFFRLTPFWECRIQSHHGFFRTNQPPYNEIKLDLATWITSAMKLKLTYKYTDYTQPNFPHHFGLNIELVK
jgi:hypothetical protein